MDYDNIQNLLNECRKWDERESLLLDNPARIVIRFDELPEDLRQAIEAWIIDEHMSAWIKMRDAVGQ